MCDILEKLKGKKPIDILKESGQANSFPVNISKILKELGIQEKETDFSEVEKMPQFQKNGQILGAVFAIGNDLNICYRKIDLNDFWDEDLTYEEKKEKIMHRVRFTLAHELAHCCLHMDPKSQRVHLEFRLSENRNSKKEIDANSFAGELLVPEHMLRRIHTQLSVPSLEFLADLFNVSRAVMRERLSSLQLPYYTNNK